MSISEEITLKDFNNFNSNDSFLEAIRNIIREQFGLKYVDEVTRAIGNINEVEKDEHKEQ